MPEAIQVGGVFTLAAILIGLESFFGLRWLVCSAGGTCLGVLGVFFTFSS